MDEPDHLVFVRSVYDHLDPIRPDFDVDVDLLAQGVIPTRPAAQVARNAALEGLETGAMES